MQNLYGQTEVEMAGFNTADMEHGRIARATHPSQSKKLMHAIKGIYFGMCAESLCEPPSDARRSEAPLLQFSSTLR